STFIGGSGEDQARGVAVDSTGNAYVGGRTSSTSFPGSSSTRPSSSNTDGFVARVNSAGNAYVYLTFVGGSGDESINAVAVDSHFNAAVAGKAGPGLPTTKSIQSYFAGGDSDAFVATLSPTGAITFSTYLGGSAGDAANGIAVDHASAIYIVGTSDSNDYPANMPFIRPNAGKQDMFITKIDPTANPQGPLILKVTING